MPFPNNLKIILLATMFNLAFEYSLRGFNGFFLTSYFPFILFGFYFTLYYMLEDIIVRFRPHNYQLVLATFFYGLFAIAFLSGSIFNRPQFLGISWTALFYVGFVWWGIVQTIFTFYFANRLVKRDWNHKKMGKLGWGLSIFYNTFFFIWFQKFNIYLSPVQSYGWPIFIIIAIATFVFLYFDMRNKAKKRETWQFQPSKIMDLLSFGSFLIFITTGSLFAGGQVVDPRCACLVNLTALRIIHFWTILSVAIFFAYRFLIRKKEITV